MVTTTGTSMAARISKGPMTFGKMWRNRVRAVLAPRERSATMNSVFFSASVLVRVRRA